MTGTSTNGTQYPIVTGEGKGIKGSIFLRTSESVKTWQDFKDESYGLIPTQVLVEGTFTANAAQPKDFGTLSTAVGKSKEF